MHSKMHNLEPAIKH